MVFFDHLHIWVFGQTTLADRREVGGLPSGAIQVMFNLGRHGVGLGPYPRGWSESLDYHECQERWRVAGGSHVTRPGGADSDSATGRITQVPRQTKVATLSAPQASSRFVWPLIGSPLLIVKKLLGI